MITLELYDYIVYDRKEDVKGRGGFFGPLRRGIKGGTAVEKQSLSQQTAQRLYNRIVIEREMAPGEKLPNELELSRSLGVSRTTLRDALRALTTQGVLEVRWGKGTFGCL